MKHLLKYLLILIFIPKLLSARKLDLSEHPFAFEIGGSYSFISSIKHLPYYTNITNNSSSYTYNGEFNILYIFSNKVSIKTGLDFIYLPKLNNITINTSSSANSLYYIYSPKLAFELLFYNNDSFRAFFGSKFLYSYFKGSSSVDLADPGTDYKVSLSKTKFTYEPFIGIEFSFVDKYSLIIKASYRILKFNNLNVSTNVQNSSVDYTDKNINFSGANIGVILRLYI